MLLWLHDPIIVVLVSVHVWVWVSCVFITTISLILFAKWDLIEFLDLILFFFILICNSVENCNNKSFWFYFVFYFYLHYHFHFHWYLLRLLDCFSLNFFGKESSIVMSYLCRMSLSGRQLKLTGFNLIITPTWFYCLLE